MTKEGHKLCRVWTFPYIMCLAVHITNGLLAFSYEVRLYNHTLK